MAFYLRRIPIVCPNTIHNGKRTIKPCAEKIPNTSICCKKCGWNAARRYYLQGSKMCNGILSNGEPCDNIVNPITKLCIKCGSLVDFQQPNADEMEKKEVLRFAQDVICCDLCPEKQTKNQVEYVCKRCNLNLCTACVGLHVSSDPSSRHDITGYKFKENDGCDNSISCEVHQNKKCELYCKNCKIPICTTCIASNLHTDHIFDEISDSCDRMKAFLREENEDLEGSIAPEYDRLISELQSTITVYKINHENMTREIKNQASQLHSQLNTSMQKLLSNAQKMEVEDMHDLSNLLSKMQRIRSSIQADIEENEKLESGNDVALLMERVHVAKAGKFRRVPPLIELTTPSFRQPEVDAEMLSKLVGDLIPSVKQTKAGYKIKLPKLGQKETE